MNNFFHFSVFIPIFLTIFISIFFTPSLYNPNNSINSQQKTQSFLWPTPGYTKITSNFGHRKAPVTGASIYHGGIDIAAPQNSAILTIADGIVSFVGWYGANGYTVIITHTNGYESIYGHISPFFLVSIGDNVYKGQKIGLVGPKYIEQKNNPTYVDKNTGKYTNGATTRSTPTFCGFFKW